MPDRIQTQFSYQPHIDQRRTAPVHHPVIVVGAGPVGLSLALDLAQRDIPVVVLDDADRIGAGSRAICFAKKTLEIFARLGCAEPMLAKGVVWQKGKVFQKNRLLYDFDLLPEDGHRMPAFINLQQYYVESFLVDRSRDLPGVDLRWRNRVIAVDRGDDSVCLTIETPDGPYTLTTDWLIACDGARSPVRGMLNLSFEGEVFDDQFLIADVRMTAPFPTERWFWFEPPFHNGQSALLHKQPDDIWRIDLQLGSDADAKAEQDPERVRARVERMLGHAAFELEWVSVYRFQCRRLSRFLHDRVIFAGDSAHQVSPFGARGANSGVQDAENLAWKLARVLKGHSPASLLETYDTERCEAADENILHSTRATDFLAPRSAAETLLRDAALDLAAMAPFARRMVNSGRLSTPTAYAASPLSMDDEEPWPGGPRPGAPIPDAPYAGSFLTEHLGADFTLLHGELANPVSPSADVKRVRVSTSDPKHMLLGQRFALSPNAALLIRPDGHVAARTIHYHPSWLDKALAKATGQVP